MIEQSDRKFLLAFRLLMAWTFLYSASHQVLNPKFSAVAFLTNTKTFHDVYAVIALPAFDPVLTFLVSYGHLLIGLSLLVGFMVRVSGIAGIILLMMYWTAHMEWPFIENHNNFIVDYHVVYSVVLLFLVVKGAGSVWGLDAWARDQPMFQRSAFLQTLVS
ncbi:MAG: DoxX [Hyphomicrobiales bacterium]|jgi:thiosulfate dehydrogenase [quinone] large subunit|nr:DoxX [Hyphomicrobiales bacterium]